MMQTRQSWMGSSKTSLFSPGSTLNEWNGKPPEVSGGGNKDVQFGRRTNRRMVSIEPESADKQYMLRTQTIGGKGFGAGYNANATIEAVNMTPRGSI